MLKNKITAQDLLVKLKTFLLAGIVAAYEEKETTTDPDKKYWLSASHKTLRYVLDYVEKEIERKTG